MKNLLPELEVSLPVYEAEIHSTSKPKYGECNYGPTEAKVITMDDGTAYDVIKGMPHDQQSDTAIVSTTEWWLHLDLEHKKKAFRAGMWLGYPVLMVGPPKGIHAKNTSLSKATYDMHQILDQELEDLNVDPMLAVVIGASRAAMIGAGLSAPQYANGRVIPYADLTAPCVPEAIKLQEWPKTIKQLGSEAKAIGGIAVEYGKRGQLVQLGRSVLPHDITHGLNALRMLPGLVRGEAGVLFDSRDPSTNIHYDMFENDDWAHIEKWEEKAAGSSKILITRKPGGHTGGIGATLTRRDINARLERLREIRGFDGSFDKVNFVRDILPVSPSLDIIEGYIGNNALQEAA